MNNKHTQSHAPARPISGDQIRSAFLDFYQKKNHKVLPSSSLVPEDPTVLLTIAGMLPFKPVFLGQRAPQANRVVTSQKCIRTNDIENVGKTARHHTFFEMLGNFSFGNYFKKEAIAWAWELCIEVFKFSPENLVVSVFRDDHEAELIWRDEVGVNPDRIIPMGEKDNFWSSGATGPCGPCSEIYYDFNPELGTNGIDLENDERFIEFYNLVFMQYNKDNDGNLLPLDNCNIDTGMGLERMAQILQCKPNNYETDLIFPLIQKISQISNLDYFKVGNKTQTSFKIIGDHIRAVIQLISDGVNVSNIGRGYILRRLIRRMVRHGRLLGVSEPFLGELAREGIELMKNSYPQLINDRNMVISELEKEEIRFLETLERGEKILDQIILNGSGKVTGQQAFELYDTYGFPLELTQEIADENKIVVDIEEFNSAMEEQRKRAKEAALTFDLTVQDAVSLGARNVTDTVFRGYVDLVMESKIIAIFSDGKPTSRAVEGDKVQLILDQTPFYGEAGGQLGDRGILFGDQLIIDIQEVTRINKVFVHSGFVREGIVKKGMRLTSKVDFYSRNCLRSNHTATHLLQSALKLVIDDSIGQRGSLVAFDHLRFDFNASSALSSDELRDIEIQVNKWILQNHSIVVKTMPIKQALDAGALAMFGEKYGDVVRVVDVPGVSMELCGGTHVTKTSELGVFKIISEVGVASGIRRIEAVSGPSVLEFLNQRDVIVKQLCDLFKTPTAEIVDRVQTLQKEAKELSKELKDVKKNLALAKVLALASQATHINGCKFLVERLDGVDSSSLQSAALQLLTQLGPNSAILLGGVPSSESQNKLVFIAAFGDKLVEDGLNAGKFVAIIAKLCGGGGGGKANIAQAGGRDAKALNTALEFARNKFEEFLQ